MNYFQKFKDLKAVEESSLDDKLQVLRDPVKVLNVGKYDWVKDHLETELKHIGFPLDIVTIVNNSERFAEDHFDIIYGMHGHDEDVSSYDEIGAFRGLGGLLIYSDCCHGKQGNESKADVWVCDDYALVYAAWAIRDVSEEVEEYIALGRNYNAIVKLALKENDLERARVFARISRFEIDDENRGERFSKFSIDRRGIEYKELAEILCASGNKKLVLDHYEDIKYKLNNHLERIEKATGQSNLKYLKEGIRELAIKEHIELFEKYNKNLGITPEEIDISSLKELVDSK